jgi:hypothetical protein
MKRVLKVLVQNINHAVANAPEQEQRSDQQKEESIVISAGGAENIGRFLHGFLWMRFAVYHRNAMGKQAVSGSSDVKRAL